MVCLAALGVVDGLCDEEISAVSLSDNGIVQGVPPGGLLLGRVQKDGSEKPMLSSSVQNVNPFVIAVRMAPDPDHCSPFGSVILHPGTEVAEDDRFAPWRNKV